MPVFLLQIINANEPHAVVRMPGGGKLELDLIESVVKAAQAKGIGFAKTEAQVMQAVREAMTEVIKALKYETVKLV